MKLSERQVPALDEAAASTAVVDPSPRTIKKENDPALAGGNAEIQRLVSRHPAGPRAFAAGNQAVSRLITQPKLTVSQPHDAYERQADAVADGVTQESLGPAPAISRLVTPGADAGEPPPETPPGLEKTVASPGPGTTIPDDVRARIEQYLGAPLGGVRVHSDQQAQVAARQLGARAFTAGGDIFLGAGESAGDLPLMAHEATHVVQQTSVGVYRSPVQRDSGGFLSGAIAELVRTVPGYDMLTVVAGYDPIANRNVDRSPENLTRGVLGLVPFGNVVAGKLIELGVVQGAYRMIDDGLRAHNLTLVRIQGEVDQAWKEIDLTDPEGAIAIVRRHVSGLYADALGFVRGILDAIVQLIRDAAVGLAEKYLVGTPVWELAKKVLHQDPLRGTPVEASTVEILSDFLTLIGKHDALAQMRERGTLQKTADWLDARIAQFLGILGELSALFQAGWDAIQPANLADLPSNLSKLATQAKGLIARIGAFASEVLTEVVKLIKDALLDWLSREAGKMRGFRLLTVILGQDPVTGKAVPRTAENLIGGFIALLPGGEATYKKLAEAGVIAEAAAQIEGAISRLGISLDMIVGTFKAIWDSLSLEDLVNPLGAFVRILDKFGEPLGRIVEFAGEVLKVVITLILRLMNFPPDLLGSIINNAMAAIEDIERDPVAFLVNMLEALKQGFLGFVDRAVGYLLNGLADWLFRGLGALGIQKPPDLSFGSILTMVLQVLDVTADKLWKKLGDHIGADVADKLRKGVAMAEGAFDFIKDVQENGVGAIWKHIESQLGNLWDTLLGMVKDWIVGEIVEKATVKLLSMLDPTGIMAVVNSSIAFFKAVQSVIEYVREILMIVNDYVTTLAAVAAGNVQAGAQKVEKGLAAAVPVAIGFLANQVGLGNVPEKLVELIGKLRELIDKALDWLFAKAVSLGKSALGALGFGGASDPAAAPPANDPTGVKAAAAQDLAAETKQQAIDDPVQVQAILDRIMEKHRPQGLKSLEVRLTAGSHFTVFAEASPADPIGEILNRPVPAGTTNEDSIEMALDAVSPETHLYAEFGEAGGVAETTQHYQNDPGGLHAEDNFMNDLERHLSLYPDGAVVPVRIKMNRLPCERCATGLAAIAQQRAKRMQLRVSSTGVYGGRRPTSWLIEGNRTQVRLDPYVKAKADTIRNLMAVATVDVWDIWSTIQAAVATDARLAGLDPDLVERNLRAAPALEGYLRHVIASTGKSFAGLRSR
ncbi:eCIS core domain-containing protein [Paractinoplanes globisporus]|uniref:DUF4157 domain-containing protein n=1 Tax=Paractinoplanes globisporus TaxID=113565 RepID=A0ABW6W5A9_9ACTN|nr:DUF4157 domain-containing protein [Actinoplanes globisporus]